MTATAPRRTSAVPAFEVPTVEVPVEPPPRESRCRDKSRSRGGGSHRHRDREKADVNTLAARVADLERRLSELRGGS